MGLRRYRVYFTPLENLDTSTYGDEIDVSDRIEISGIGSLKKGIDSSDYSLGVFFFSDITISGFNFNGYFNEPGDYRSIFTVSRDRCKVRVVFEETEVTRNSSSVPTDDVTVQTVTFEGLINEEGTRFEPQTDKITFKVLSRDSVLRTTKISPGVVNDDTLTSVAIYDILNQPRITSVLTLDVLNINPDTDINIDDGTFFDNKTVKEALDAVMIATNSILYVNRDGEIIVSSRDENVDSDIINLYGRSELHGRENIITITAYNSGFHRTFTSFLVNNTEVGDNNLALSYGFRQQQLDLEFITELETETLIAESLLEEFKTPRIELNVQVPVSVARNANPLDRVSIDFPFRVKPVDGTFLPVVGATQIDDASMPLPQIFGSLEILPRSAFKILEIQENPNDFTAILKLRQTNDFVFDTPNNCIDGYAIVDQAEICSGDDTCATWNPSVVGAASVGCTEVA